MSPRAALADRFAAARPRLLRLAYSQLGDLGEAEDVVQEAWLRLERAGAESIEDLDAWLTTAVGRLALDALRSARARRERYVGPWLPEPVIAPVAAATPPPDPADRVTLDESVSYALLAVLEQLSPAERTAFVLHDVFDVPFAEVGEIVGRTPESARQLASRARRHVTAARPRHPVEAGEHRRLVEAFAKATAEGDMALMLEILDPDVTFTADGGGRVIAARKPLHGARRVAKAWLKINSETRHTARREIVDLNGQPGLVVLRPDGVPSVLAFTVDDGRIVRVDVMRNPDKLHLVSDRQMPAMGGMTQPHDKRPAPRRPRRRAFGP